MEFKVGDRVRLICCRRYGTIIKEKEMFGTRPHYTVLFDYDETDCLVPEEDLEIVDEHGKTLLEQRIEKLEKCVMGEQNSLEKSENVSNFEKTTQKSNLLSEDERVILRNLDNRYKWIARDSSDNLWLFENEPKKSVGGWYDGYVCCEGFYFFDHIFKFIKWKGGKPYNIEELLKGECGNEN